MEILYDYKPFDRPKIGVFNVETNVYKLPEGWIRKKQEITIIGETDLHYITRLQESSLGEWVNGEVITSHFILPLGPHKSRLVSWKAELLF